MEIISFTSLNATLQNAGGKGANLVRLTRAGFPVPPGFILPTGAYRAYVSANHLPKIIEAATLDLAPHDAARLEQASTQIRAAFAAGEIPAEIESTLRAAYTAFEAGPVAVRSSATTEDLPDLSFAGQQDTFLNVSGTDALLQAVVNCWSSLWTARAIGYRLRNGINHGEAALAVVVQQMVPSEVSGVLFTANPLTGLRTETVIDAALGLGESLVSGQVQPDHFVVDTQTGSVKSRALAARQPASPETGDGKLGRRQIDQEQPTLSENQIRQLTELGRQVQEEYQAPQDIEWAFADGRLYLLQSRPITSLFPVPEVSLDPLIVWFGFGTVQGTLGPMTPLGRDGIRNVFAGAGSLFGQRFEPERMSLVVSAGERLWIKISDMIRHPIGNRLSLGFLAFVEPSVAQIIRSLTADPRLGAGQGRFKFSTLWRVVRFFGPVLVRILPVLARPEKARARFDAQIEAYLSTATIVPAADRFERLANIAGFIRERIAGVFQFLLPEFIPIFAPSMAALNLLNKIAGQDRSLVLEITRGLPGNVTTQMDLFLWQTAQTIQADADSAAIFQDHPADFLARRYLNNALPPIAQRAIERFMQRYGMRGVSEIDLGQPRWREDPTPVMQTLKSYLEIDPESAPDILFARGERAACAAIEELASRVRRQHGGRFKSHLVRAAAHRIRALMGARESPKFFAIRTMGIARAALLDVGCEFAAAGALERPEDLFFLRLSELEALSRREPRDWQALVSERRSAYEREQRRRQVPRVLVSDGRAFYEGLGAETDTGDLITGSPVSPGVVEGIVHVVLDPHGARLAPGEILVCPGTDPAWTPLFMAAGGLITEVGGMMTHGSVVAREYGIPAVVGVHNATSRLQNGQRIRVDGTQGKIIITGP